MEYLENRKLYPIGTKYIAEGKRKDIETVTEIFKTYNSKNELVKIEYIVEHDFLNQKISHAVCHTTIRKAEIQGRILN
jgi:hypothetical protein